MKKSGEYSIQLGEEEIYAAAMSELNSDARRPGVWAKAMADSDGDEAKSKALYIRLRVQQEHDRIQRDLEQQKERTRRKEATFASLIKALNECEYKTSRDGTGWTVRDPLWQRHRFESVESLITYLKGETYLKFEKRVAALVADLGSDGAQKEEPVIREESTSANLISQAPPSSSYIRSPELATNIGALEPSGVGGWLLLLVVGMMGLGQLITAGFLGGRFYVLEMQYPSLVSSDKWQSYESATWWAFWVIAATNVYGGYGLATKREWRVVIRAKVILWLTGPGGLLVVQVLVPMLMLGEFNGKMGQAVGSFLGATLGTFAWTSYLDKSKRVRNTYVD